MLDIEDWITALVVSGWAPAVFLAMGTTALRSN